MSPEVAANVAASLLIAALVVAIVLVTGGPLWAALGFGCVAYAAVAEERS